jgi:hypothetical protein
LSPRASIDTIQRGRFGALLLRAGASWRNNWLRVPAKLPEISSKVRGSLCETR